MTIPAATSEIIALLSDDPLTNAQYLQLLKLTRDQLLFSMHSSDAVTKLEVNRKTVEVSDPKALLDMLENMLIPRYERLVAAATAGRSTRTVAKLTRR